ncbi:MAG: RidA family protein [Bacteroidota bacterium]
MKRIIKTPKAPMPIGPYNQAVFTTGGTLYISGQIPMNPETGKLVETGIKDATKQVMQNLKAILTEADLSFSNVVKSSIFIEDMDDFADINEVYGAYFDERTAPARETVQVAKLPLGVAVEISVIAVSER